MQIRKYLDGQLDARAMHQLERRALDDPFLADALEGYGEAAKDQKGNLAELEERLQNRTEKKVRPMWMPISAAASVLVIIAFGIWLFTKDQGVKKKEIAEVVKPDILQKPPVPSPSVTDTIKPEKDKAIAVGRAPEFSAPSVVADKAVSAKPTDDNMQYPAGSHNITDTNLFVKKAPASTESDGYANNPPPAVADVKVNAPSPSLNEVVVQSQKPGAKDKTNMASVSPAKPNSKESPETLLTSKVEGLDINPSRSATLTGLVTSAGGNEPLVGAIVKLAGSNFGAVTDANGKFVLHDVTGKKSLTVGYLGYATKQVKLNGSDSINVALSPTGSALSEVVVVSNEKKRNKNNVGSASDAHPGAGWKTLNDYLDKNAISPDGQGGKVNLSFTVDGQGNLNNFKILKSLNTTADKKAVDLLIAGPAWIGNADGQTHEVKLTIVFK